LRRPWEEVKLTCEMCLGKIERLAEIWEEGGTRVGRSECGVVLSLAFAPDAVVGSHVVAHAGVAVRVLDPGSAEEAEALREAMQA
jgi:hydrogenase maturation factor